MDLFNPPSAAPLAVAMQLILAGLFIYCSRRGQWLYSLSLVVAFVAMTWVEIDMLRVRAGWDHALNTPGSDVGPNASPYTLMMLMALLFASLWPLFAGFNRDKPVLLTAGALGFTAVFTMMQDVALHIFYEDGYALGISVGWIAVAFTGSVFLTAVAFAGVKKFRRPQVAMTPI
jgi:hypothetical protein